MNKTKHLFLKLFILLMFGVGWSGSAWAQRFTPTFAANEAAATEWHYIIFSLKSGSPRMYANTGNGQFNWSTSTPTDDYKWYLIGSKDNFIMKSVSGKYVYTTETGTNQGVQYLITENAGSATHFNLVNGNNANTWAIHRISGNTGNNMNHRGNGGIMEWTVDDGCSVTFSNPREIIKYSDAPSATAWATNTNWFTIRNNRNNQNDQYNRTFITTSANGVNDAFNILPVAKTMPNDRGSYWCFVGNAAGFVIQNAAYGPDFVLAISGNNSNATMQMFRKGEVPSDYTYNFTAVDNSVVDDGSFAYAFRLGTTGNTHIHVTQGKFIIYNHTAISGNDTGSAFKLTLTDNSVVNTLQDYDVYKVDIASGGTVSYTGTRTVFGKRGSQPSPYFILAKGGPEVTQANIQSARGIESFSLTTPSSTYIKNISIKLSLPEIVHRRAYFYDKYKTVSDDKKPRNSSYVGKDYLDPNADDFGYVMNGTTKIQKTSEFRIPVYLKPGTYRQMYMPTDKLAYYQRWYNYKTEGLVNTGVMPALYSSNFKTYSNGHVSGKVASGIIEWQQNPTFYLPTDAGLAKDANGIYEDYLVGVDVSRYKDNSTSSTGNLTEPTLSQRVIFEIKDANKIAKELTACTGDKWLEERSIIFPTIKRGTSNRKTHQDVLPLNMDLYNYWVYSASNQLVQLTTRDQIEVVVEGNAVIKASLIGDSNDGGLQGVNFNQGHFIRFEYPGTGTVRQVPDNSHATVKVYFKEDTKKYQLAKFELTFAPDTDPRIITEIIGKDGDQYKSERSPYSLKEKYGNPVAELTFENKSIMMRDNLPTGGVDKAGGTDINTYLFPLDFAMTNYAYGYEKGDGTARGEYTIANARHIPGQGGFRFKPVQFYYDILNGGTTNEHNDDQFYIYVDASDQPGEVMSLTIRDNLCAGTRLYVSGWMSTTSNGSNPASVILNLVGKNSESGNSKILTSYCPGMLHTFMYDENGNEVAGMNNTSGETASTINTNGQYWGLWSQISFSFLLTSADVDNYDEFQLQVLNNCFNSSGGDYLLDNFQIFANPPRAEVDFTTPLCSDKVRHVKVHTDFNMLKNLSNLNDEIQSQGENDEEPKLYATFCFVNKKKFDEYKGTYAQPMSYYFIKDDRGNHILNERAHVDHNPDKEVLTAVLNQINEAFGAALVGERTTDKSNDAHGFHVIQIPATFNDIKPYVYTDSQDDTPYRETVNGVDRVVFKEPVVRSGVDDGLHLHSSTEYYIVFAGHEVTTGMITQHNTATEHFGIQTVCSFLGEFKTKDPMHVILDNADIESDLPVEAVCHGDEVTLSFNMPARKVNKPIIDEAYCISDESMDDKIVPSTNGANHYRYEASFNTTPEIKETVVNLPYDWWLGGTIGSKTYKGSIDGENGYNDATHPTYTYPSTTQDQAHKPVGTKVKIAQAMKDFRFFYPDFGKDDSNWNNVGPKPYNSKTGYGFLQEEKDAIKDFVDAGIIVLYKTDYTTKRTFENAEELTDDEKTQMSEAELTKQILALAMKLDDAALVKLESSALANLSDNGKKELTFEEFNNMTLDELKALAKSELHYTDAQVDQLSIGQLRNDIEAHLLTLTPAQLENLAKEKFPNLQQDERANLVIRALNLIARETVAAMPSTDQQDQVKVRKALRDKTIAVFEGVNDVDILRTMWKDASAKLTTKAIEDLKSAHGDPANLTDKHELAYIVEQALAKITEKVVADLDKDKYVHFTLIPIMPSQENYVDQPYIFCPEPRGVKVTLRNAAPQMLNGFGGMSYRYPETMKNVPVRAGVQQLNAVSRDISSTIPADAKTLRIPLRGLTKALDEGQFLEPYEKAGNTDIKTVFLVDTNDSAYEKELDLEQEETEDMMLEAWGKVKYMKAKFGDVDNYMELVFNENKPMHEGHTYRIGVRFVESYIDETDAEKKRKRDIACDGILYFDLKVVPEYQIWKGKESGAEATNWTNDHNWARADRDELLAEGTKTGDVISESTAFQNADNYATNQVNFGNNIKAGTYGFMPMYFTNVLFNDAKAKAPVMGTTTVSNGFLAIKGSGDQVVVPDTLGNRSGFENHTMIDHKLPKSVAFLRDDTVATDKTIYSIAYDMAVAPCTVTAKNDGDTGETTATKVELDTRYTTSFGGQNYMCEPLFTNVAKGVTFAPQTQLINAQYLNYYKAWVEYELDVNRWYTLGSPLQNTFAGEWYAPTDGAKQKSPYFYDIKYVQRSNDGTTGYNDRFRPAIYQRSWDSEGNVPVYMKAGGTASWGSNEQGNLNEEPAYVKADWSYVFNDVKKQYSTGGFSVKVNTDLLAGNQKPSDGKAIVRLPKADIEYTYYDSDQTTSTTPLVHQLPYVSNRGRLWSDNLAGSTTEFQQTITNSTNDNYFFLVSNPFIANLDMSKFFADENNTAQFEQKYWIMTADGQIVSVKNETTTSGKWISTVTGDDGKVAPLQGFFLKGKGGHNSATVTFTADMQANPTTKGTANELKSRPETASSIQTLAMTAKRDDFTSTAVVAISNGASKEYVSSEDCETFIDSDIADQPTIYTVASGQAMTVNTVSSFEMIAVGILGKEGDEADVTFSGISETLFLYDSKEGSYVEIQDGTELQMACSAAGRYFITASPTAIEEVTDNDRIRMGVWSVNGTYCGDTTNGLAPGLYIVDGVKMNIR